MSPSLSHLQWKLPMTRLPTLAYAFLLSLAFSTPVFAFEYIEHSFFADRACHEAQRRLLHRMERVSTDSDLVERYLAISLLCPLAWKRNYCEDGQKQAEASLNRLPSPRGSRDVSLTFGDLAALPDHISSFGPIRGLPPSASRRKGLLEKVFQWMATPPGRVTGVVPRIAQPVCEASTGVTPWRRVEHDIATHLAIQDRDEELPSIPYPFLSALQRSAVPRGPRDPAAAYSMTNPHFLDLLLRDTHHFGEAAYSSWLGFHSKAVDIGRRSCRDTIDFSARTMRVYSANTPGYDHIDWKQLSIRERREWSCGVLAEHIRIHLLTWATHADKALVAPLEHLLETYTSTGDSAAAAGRERIVGLVMSLVFEGSGLHFLQDGLAAGHMRMSNRRSMGERRYDHDLDNREGVVAAVRTAVNEHTFVAFGDSYLLGPPADPERLCDLDKLAFSDSPERVSDCLIAHQRSIVVATATASLLDWALDGFMYTDTPGGGPDCASGDPEERFICRSLPLQAPGVPGHTQARSRPTSLQHGVMPIPPPRLSYESLSISAAFDIAGTGNQLGLELAFYSEMGNWASWLRSYRIGLRSTDGSPDRNQFIADFSYGFHWRWAARFLIDAEPFVYAGLEGVRPERSLRMGLGPRFGVTVLPEGLVKIPLELGLAYRWPITLFTSGREGIETGLHTEAHWLHFSLGLAFM